VALIAIPHSLRILQLLSNQFYDTNKDDFA
jgi:hypothetical protein